jgi:signal transduction histidine kinase
MISTALHRGLDWLVPRGHAPDAAAHWKLRMLGFGLLFGPVLADTVLLYIVLALPGERAPLWIIAPGVHGFWLLLVPLKRGVGLERLALPALAGAILVAMVATLCYGGLNSAFLPWLLMAAATGAFCLRHRPRLLGAAAIGSLALLAVADRLTAPIRQSPSPETLLNMGVIGLFAAAAFIALLAVYSAGAATALEDVSREAARQRGRIARMRRVTDAAEEANNRKSLFLVNMTHRLRTPLNAVIGYSEMALEDAQQTYDEQQIADMSRINMASKHLLSLMTDVMDISKIEASETELSVDTFELTRFFDNIVATARHLVVANGNELVVAIPQGCGLMISDQMRLRQIVLNLLSNAGKFTSQGKIGLTIERENDGRIDWISIEVSDTGIGIAKDSLGKMFGNFHQAEASTSGTYGGTGLGLNICRDFCQAMGGTITVASEQGKGSRFTVRLPADITDDRAYKLMETARTRVAAA